MSTKVIIRNYKDSDYNSFRDTLKEAGLLSEHLDDRDSVREKAKIFPGSVIVAVTSDQVVGCVYALREVHGISHLAVKRKYRKIGVGSKLLSAAEDYLANEGIREWTLFAYRNRKKLLEYYTKRGYGKGNEFVIFTKRKKSR